MAEKAEGRKQKAEGRISAFCLPPSAFCLLQRRALLLFSFLLVPGLSAHEIGTTRVTASFLRDGTYQIDIVVDPENLLTRLELLVGEERTTTLPSAELRRRIEARAPLFLENVRVRLDQTVVQPRFQYLPISETPASEERSRSITGMVRLEGSIPPGASTFRWTYALPYGSYALGLKNEGDPHVDWQWLEGGSESEPFALRERVAPLTRGMTALLYLKLGFTHIIPKGLDHILFVLGIFLLSARLSAVVAQVTAFTLAHSITLALTIYGVFSLSPRIVEPAIALSIAYVGVENVLTREIRPWRIALVFAFGLLHGMGFAGVLSELSLPRSEFLTALVSFNVGVEIGQFSVIALAFLLVASWARKKEWYRRAVVVPLSLLIAATGLYWTVTRIAGW